VGDHPLCEFIRGVCRVRRRSAVRVAGSAAVLCLFVAVSHVALAVTRPVGSTSDGADRAVSVVAYDLGDTVFAPGDAGPTELAAIVHYPRDLVTGTHPLILQLHGSWFSCNDKAAWARALDALEAGDDEGYFDAVQPMGAWPCRGGTPPLENHRGYDYLGVELARHGFVVVSISANGINSHEGAHGYQARAALVNKHLAMWQRLAADGTGELRDAFVDPATGHDRQVPFVGHVDMTNVGTMGHSRGGKGVMWQAADKHRDEWPNGVQVKAVMPYAGVYFNIREDDDSDGLVTTMPVGVIVGTCDGAVGTAALSYIDDARGKNTWGMFGITIHGANHNFFNTQWSPRSGDAGAQDDAADDRFRPPGCSATPPDPAHGARTPGDRRLNEDDQRTIATTYVVDFFRWALLDDAAAYPVLTGATFPHANVAAVGVTAVVPAVPTSTRASRQR